MSSDEERSANTPPPAGLRPSDAARRSRQSRPRKVEQRLKEARNVGAFLLGLATIILAGLGAVGVFMSYTWAGFGDGGSTSVSSNFWMGPVIFFTVLALVFASLRLSRNRAFMHMTAIVVLLAIVTLIIVSLRRAEAAHLCYGLLGYLLFWLGFYFLTIRTKPDPMSTGRIIPREMHMLRQLPRGLHQEEVRQRLGEPLSVFRQARETFWRYGHEPQEKWVYAIFGPDQRFKRFELD